jgi:hypothetical protein
MAAIAGPDSGDMVSDTYYISLESDDSWKANAYIINKEMKRLADMEKERSMWRLKARRHRYHQRKWGTNKPRRRK